jgi:spectinomycin phosphotransferase
VLALTPQLLIVRSPFERVDEEAIRNAVADGWALPIGRLRYVPEGAGAYHWTTHTDDVPWFITCDDLDTKPWLGSDRESVFDGLLAAYRTAIELRRAGLEFIVAPRPMLSGAPGARVDNRHSVSVFEYVAGEPGRWGRPVASRLALVTMLARLHQTMPVAHGLARRGLDLPGRDRFEQALGQVDRPWDGGPLSELARHELVRHLGVVARSLTELDRLAAGLDHADGHAVASHGEPHPGNFIQTPTGLVLVDWDTVALARPERDLWMIVDSSESVPSAYQELTGVTLDRDALAAYRLLWALTDVAAYTLQLRDEHQHGPDADQALAGLRSILNGREPTPYGLPLRERAR